MSEEQQKQLVQVLSQKLYSEISLEKANELIRQIAEVEAEKAVASMGDQERQDLYKEIFTS